jgi:concanavalin A-like lectin/glucanase superfamily protein
VKQGRIVSFVGAVAIATALWASSASAATLIGDYQFQGTRASSVPGAPLIDVGGFNSFQQDTVMGVPRQVLAFPQHSGVQISPTGLGGSTGPAYSAVTTVRLDTVSGYVRILDPSNGTNDFGFYTQNGAARYVGANVDYLGDNAVLADGVYATVAITSQPSPTRTRFYVNGSLQLDDTKTEAVIADTLRFFKDNVTGGSTGEDSAGAVSCIRVYSGVLSDAEVGGIGASPTCGTVTPPSTTTKKKCKKHKKKHRAAEAKKKCKKKKKR